MAVTMSTFSDALKIVYQDVVAEQINIGTGALYGKIEQTTKNIEGGLKVVKSVPYGLNGGAGAFSEGGSNNIPNPGGNKHKTFESTLKNLAATISLTDKAIKASKSNRAAFVSALEDEMNGAMKAAKFSVGSGIMLPSTGVRAICGATTASVTVVVDSVQYLMEGMTIDIVATADGTAVSNGTGRRIAAVNRAANTIVLEGSATVTTTSSHCVVEQKSYNNNVTGMADIFAQSGSLYGLSKTTYPWLKPDVSTGTDVEISDGVIIKKVIDINNNSGGKTDLITCHPEVYVAYYNYLEATKRNVNTTVLSGGFESLSIQGPNGKVPITSDKFEKARTMRLLDTTQFNLHQLEDWSWMDNDGSILKWVSNSDAWIAVLVKYCELICNHPGAQGAIEQIVIS